jgi:8-oxo-dGTP pyrophosphatase MutT (NUDIX family)
MKSIDTFLLEQEEKISTGESCKALVKMGDHILILRINEDHGGAGMWDIPGGRSEGEETKENTLVREIFEETNLTVSDIKKIDSIKLVIPERGIDLKVHIFKCNAEHSDIQLKPSAWSDPTSQVPFMWGGEQAPSEHSEYKWIEYKTELKNLPMLDVFKNLLMKHLK